MSALFVISYVALWALVIFQSIVLVGLVRALARLQQRGAQVDGPIDHHDHLAGREAPEFSATDLSGRLVRASEFAGRPRAFLFVSPECRTCRLTLSEMNALEWKAEGTVVVICQSGRSECRALAERFDLEAPVLVDEDAAISDLFAVNGVPTAVLVTADDQIASYGQPMRGEELDEMLRDGDRAALEQA
ncbi:MAG: TlpA family protein disulfide reductase [Gemmatimonadaceae bacterium]